jgi:hypothetical protein
MRTTLRSRLSLLFLSFALVLALPAMALADNVVRDEVVASGKDTITTSSSTTINYQIKNNSSGGANNEFKLCDASDGSPVTVTIVKPAAVTASPGTLTFNSCDSPKPVQFSSNTPGDYQITVTTSDTRGNYSVGDAAFTLHVTAPPPPSNTAPKLTLPANQTAEATGSGGAAVNFNATATDAEDGTLTPSCSPASGSTFALGTTQVNCSVKDSGGLSDSGFFAVTVQDTTKPVIAAHADVTAEATGPNGAVVNYTSPATSDAVYGSGTANCLPASGSQFPLGSTTVTCNATDGSGNEAVATTFNVIVKDTTAPTLTVPSAPVVIEATGPTGAEAIYQVSAEDDVDSAPTTSCTPATGTMFKIGDTTVTCTAKDDAGNISAAKSFKVTVQDTTKPTLNLPANITEEATGPDGNVVNYSASASDLVSGNVNVTCTPASGATFGIQTTTVNCEATDGSSSGLNAAGCVVTGYSTAVGTHTLIATATDKAGNTATKTLLSYTVKPYSFSGFYQPVDMNGVYNTVKAGSTVPLKFELFKGATELTSTSYIIQPLTTQRVTCQLGAFVDEIELLATGGTNLRYDSTGGQFIYNWQTPKAAGSCYKVTVSATDGSSSITAYFQLK